MKFLGLILLNTQNYHGFLVKRPATRSLPLASKSDRFIIFHFAEVINQRCDSAENRTAVNCESIQQQQRKHTQLLGHENLVRLQLSDLIGARGDVWFKLSAGRKCVWRFLSSLAPRPKVCPQRCQAKDRDRSWLSHLTTIFFRLLKFMSGGQCIALRQEPKMADTMSKTTKIMACKQKD
jgi:hypothetical protein